MMMMKRDVYCDQVLRDFVLSAFLIVRVWENRLEDDAE